MRERGFSLFGCGARHLLFNTRSAGKDMKTDMERAFWDRSWGSVAPERIAAYAASLDPAADAIVTFLQKRGARRVCDAGCGCGAYALKLARFGFSVSGFDIAEDAVSLAEKLFSESGCSAAGFRQADVLSTGYTDGCFDAVVARDVVDHMPIRQGMAAVRELLRIVRPGGCVLLTLDKTDDQYEAEPHETNEEGDYLFTDGKWEGMVFHPYSAREIEKLTDGAAHEVLLADENGFLVVLAAGEQTKRS